MKITSILLASLFAAVAVAQTPAPAPAAAPAAAPAPAAVAAPAPKAEEKKAAVGAATVGDVSTGKAAWYGKKFHGRKTASGQRHNTHHLTAASNTFPFGTLVRVTNVKNKKSVVVRINDRMPKSGDRTIDVSRAAAAKLGMFKAGVVDVELKVVGHAKGKGARGGKHHGKGKGMGKAHRHNGAKKAAAKAPGQGAQ